MAADRPEQFYYEEQPPDMAGVTPTATSSSKTFVHNTVMKNEDQLVSSIKTERLVEISKNDNIELLAAMCGKEYKMIVNELTKSLGHRNPIVIAKNWTTIRKVIDKSKKKFK